MTSPHGTADFFALEAGECLDRIETAITRDGGPRTDDLLRAARALRGSALMAGHTAIARAAAGFEGLARAVRDGAARWNGAMQERAAQGVDELRQMVRRAREWTDADTTRAGRLAADLDALAGSASGDVLRPGATPGSSGAAGTGVRAFVARESALIASALDRAARALESTPESREPLYAVLRRMQSLRGLAEIADLPPLPEILDGIELAVGDLTRLFAPPPNVSAVLDSAAAALTRISRDVTEHGHPAGDPPEARAFTEGLLRAFAAEADVVPIQSLFRPDDPEPVQRSTAQPQFAPAAPLGAVEMVSYGEHLAQAADRIAASRPGTARDLRLYTLVSTFRSVTVAGSDPVTPALARLGRAARMAIGSGAAGADPEGFAVVLREASVLLSGLAEQADHAATARRLDALAMRLGGADEAATPDAVAEAATTAPATLAPTDAPAAVGTEAPAVETIGSEPAEPLMPVLEPLMPVAEPRMPAVESPMPVVEPAMADVESAEPVPIDSLAYDGESALAAEAIVPIESLAPSGRTVLEQGFDTYRRLLAHPPAAAARIDQPEAAVAQRSAAADADVVDISSLCYSGRRALERAAEIRAELAHQDRIGAELGRAEPLVRELLDLIPLALAG